jgi:hypothetical protein
VTLGHVGSEAVAWRLMKLLMTSGKVASDWAVRPVGR